MGAANFTQGFAGFAIFFVAQFFNCPCVYPRYLLKLVTKGLFPPQPMGGGVVLRQQGVGALFSEQGTENVFRPNIGPPQNWLQVGQSNHTIFFDLNIGPHWNPSSLASSGRKVESIHWGVQHPSPPYPPPPGPGQIVNTPSSTEGTFFPIIVWNWCSSMLFH